MGEKTLYLPSSVQTGGVALPRQAESEITREQHQLALELYEVTGKLEHYTRMLQQIDPYLSVILAKPHTTVDGLRPNFYHIIRRAPGAPAYIKVIETPDGEWRDLDSSVFDLAAEDDLWNDRTQRERREKAKRAEDARQRQIIRERQERAAEFDERLWSATHTSVSVPRNI
jgi:hypothetical protein